MVIEQQTANRYGRAFTDANIQINWRTATLDFTGTVAASTYPSLFRGGATSAYTFTEDSVIMGAHLSVSWVTAAAAETGCIALAPDTGAAMNVLGPSNLLLKTAVICTAAVAAGTLIERDPGFVFPSPFVKFVQKNTALALYGSKNPNITYGALATIYFVPVPDFLNFMQQALG